MTSKSEIQLLFHTWNEALKTKNSSEVVKLYAPDAVLLPTLSPVVRNSHEKIQDYFDFFLGMAPSAKIREEHIRIFGDIAVNSGIYVFSVTRDGEAVEIPVRFTFVYRKLDSQWLIAEHHSSAMPQA
jgi:uncharacterized protein (TIGR02246 family)